MLPPVLLIICIFSSSFFIIIILEFLSSGLTYSYSPINMSARQRYTCVVTRLRVRSCVRMCVCTFHIHLSVAAAAGALRTHNTRPKHSPPSHCRLPIRVHIHIQAEHTFSALQLCFHTYNTLPPIWECTGNTNKTCISRTFFSYYLRLRLPRLEREKKIKIK